MKKFTLHKIAGATFFLGFLFACTEDLVKLNTNPNGADPESTNPNMVLSTVLTETGKAYVNLGYQDLAGVMQHTQKDGWTGGHNEYDWGGSNSWSGYYHILRNNKYVYDRSVELGYELQQGISLVMKSMLFGLITDLWGDAPYTYALNGEEAGQENTFPPFDEQETIYMGILADLEKASDLLSKPATEYSSTVEDVDVYYGGDPAAWRKLANSLMLRYYMRLSEKLPQVAREGIEKITGDPGKYPIILNASEDAAMPFAGNSNDDSWPANTACDSDGGSNFRRLKMCSSLVKAMLALNDPRLGIWARKVEIFLRVDEDLPPGTDRIADTIVNGESRKVRYLSPDVLADRNVSLEDIDQHTGYVGLPPAIPGPQVYNMSPDANQAAFNPHVSWLNDIFRAPRGDLLKARLLSAAEVHFILAEAALKGWNAGGGAQEHYQAGIQASFEAWGLAGAAPDYIAQPVTAFNGTVKQIIEQKWIASWTAAAEAWFDYRRTGYPELQAGPQAKAPVLPLRFYYMLEERNLNRENVDEAIGRLETTIYSAFGADGEGNSPWSKPWVIQGTGKPW